MTQRRSASVLAGAIVALAALALAAVWSNSSEIPEPSGDTREQRAGVFDSVDTVSTVGGGLAVVVALLVLGGVVLAVWSLLVARRRPSQS